MEEQMMNELNITEEHVYMLFNGGVFLTTHFLVASVIITVVQNALILQ